MVFQNARGMPKEIIGDKMTIHEFGKENNRTVVLIHPAIVMWDYFEYVIPILQKHFHLIVPAIPGYDEYRQGDFSSVEEIAAELEGWLTDNGKTNIACIFGCSMGGSIVLRLLANNRIKAENAVIDAGITPYRLPWIVTRFIAIKDFLLISIGKIGGIRLLEKVFEADEYSKEDHQYMARVLKMISYKTIWRTFESCNNYSMPKRIDTDCGNIEYWFTEKERKERKKDIEFVKTYLPKTHFKVFDEIGHAGLALKKPEDFTNEIIRICERSSEK